MIATPYTTPVAILLSLALIPTIIHSYLKLTDDNTAPSAAIKADLGELFSAPTRRNPGWGEETFGCTDWFERAYKDRQGNTARLFVGRAYDHKRLYHHPELALSHGSDLRKNGQIVLAGTPPVTVNVLHHSTQPNIAAYALFYDGQFISNPIAHQVKSSLSLMVSAEKPMTLFYVFEENADKQVGFEKTFAAKVLKAAIGDYLTKIPLVKQ